MCYDRAMRFAGLVVVVLALGGCNACKDKPAARQEPADEPPRLAQPTVQAPDVSGPGVVRVDKLAARISLSRTELRLDEDAIATLNDGALDKDTLTKLMVALAPKAKVEQPIGIALDATLPYYRVTALLGALRNAGHKRLALLVGDGSLMVPIDMPDAKDVVGTVRPVVTVVRGRVKLWSQTGTEGTLAKPLLDHPLEKGTQPLTDALVAMVKRRWPTGERGMQDKAIFVQIGGAETAETLLRVIAAVRTSGTAELFPVIFLMGGA